MEDMPHAQFGLQKVGESTAVIGGAIGQEVGPSALPAIKGKKSGLVEAAKILKAVKDIDFCYLKETDVVRHELVRKIIAAYDQYYKRYPSE